MIVFRQIRLAKSADPDQTAPLGAVWSGSSLFTIPSASFGRITYEMSQAKTKVCTCIKGHVCQVKKQISVIQAVWSVFIEDKALWVFATHGAPSKDCDSWSESCWIWHTAKADLSPTGSDRLWKLLWVLLDLTDCVKADLSPAGSDTVKADLSPAGSDTVKADLSPTGSDSCESWSESCWIWQTVKADLIPAGSDTVKADLSPAECTSKFYVLQCQSSFIVKQGNKIKQLETVSGVLLFCFKDEIILYHISWLYKLQLSIRACKYKCNFHKTELFDA